VTTQQKILLEGIGGSDRVFEPYTESHLKSPYQVVICFYWDGVCVWFFEKKEGVYIF
jgi:hypothetical protein